VWRSTLLKYTFILITRPQTSLFVDQENLITSGKVSIIQPRF